MVLISLFLYAPVTPPPCATLVLPQCQDYTVAQDLTAIKQRLAEEALEEVWEEEEDGKKAPSALKGR